MSDHLPVFAVFVMGCNRVDNDGIKPATNSQRMKLDQGTQQSVMPSLLILICRQMKMNTMWRKLNSVLKSCDTLNETGKGTVTRSKPNPHARRFWSDNLSLLVQQRGSQVPSLNGQMQEDHVRKTTTSSCSIEKQNVNSDLNLEELRQHTSRLQKNRWSGTKMSTTSSSGIYSTGRSVKEQSTLGKRR